MNKTKVAAGWLKTIPTQFRRLVILTSRACQRRRCRHYEKCLRGNGFYMRETPRRRGRIFYRHVLNFDAPLFSGGQELRKLGAVIDIMVA